MLPALLAGAGLLGKLFSGGAKSSASDREQQNSDAVMQDRTRADSMADYERALQERAAIDLRQRESDAKARTGGYREAMHSQYLQNWQPAQRPNGIQTIRGGFNTVPQASRDMAKMYEQQAMAKALQGEKFNQMPAIERFQQSTMKQPSLWEKVSGAIGLGLQGASAVGGLMGGGSGATPPYIDPRVGNQDDGYTQ
jgi:hypothetical protein